MTLRNSSMLQSPLAHALVLLAISVPYFVNLGKSSIWDANEAFYAETPREMLATGDYLAPQFNFQPRTQKPPLTYWVVLASYKVFGVSEFAVRLPSAFAAAGTILFSYGTARMLFNPRAALMAALVTAATPRIFILARRLPIDILLLFFLTGTLYFLVRSVQKNRTGAWALAYLFAGLGFLTKGPIAVVIPAGAYLVWAFWGRRRHGPGVRSWMGLAILLAVVLPWYVWVYHAHGWTYIAPFFLRDNLGRFASQSLGPARGPLYYVTVYLADFFPWSLMALVAVWLLISIRKSEQPMKSLSWGLPLAWCGLVFLLFSLSKNKQEYYIAPMYPPAAIILSGILDKIFYRSMQAGAPHAPGASLPMGVQPAATRYGYSLYALLSILFAALSGIFAFALHAFMPNLPPVLHYVPSLVFGAAGILTAWSLVRKKSGRCFPILAVSLVTAYWMCPWFYLPAAEAFRPVKDFCRIIESQSRPDDEAGFYGTALPSMVFYLRRPVFEENDAEGMRRRFESGRRVFCILSERDYALFARSGGAALYVLDRRPRLALRMRSLLRSGGFPEEQMLLVSNRPGSAVEFNKDRPVS